MGTIRRNTDATDLVNKFAAGDTNPVEAMQAALDRLERLNPSLNAIVHPRPEAAMREAAAAAKRWEARRASGDDGEEAMRVGGAVFDGVPMAVKDLGCEQAGEPYHAGARFLVERQWLGRTDSHLYRRLRAGGLVSIGRTNTPEFGTTITTEPLAYGPTANPWDLTRSAGGSSGGSAAAVAAAIVPVAHGNDGGGSIRVPAAACGLVGLKATRGRVSPAPRLGEHRGGLAIDGMLTRTVRDAARCLDVISLPAVGDPYAAPSRHFANSFTEALTVSTQKLAIAVSWGPPDGPLASPSVVEAMQQAAAKLEDEGHKLTYEAAPDGWYSSELADHLSVLRTVGLAAELDGWEARLGRALTQDDLEPANWFAAQLGRSLPATAYVDARAGIDAWRRRVMAFWGEPRHTASPDESMTIPYRLGHQGYDLLMTPVLTGQTPPLGYLSDPDEGAQRVASLAAFVNQANATGQPVICLPMGADADGLPVGVQFHAEHGGEEMLLAFAQRVASADGLIRLRELPRA